jgi:hypothetical protein
VSQAVEGEQVILFLFPAQGEEPAVLVFLGRGRMPIREVKGKQYADYSDAIAYPLATPTIDGPKRGDSFVRSIELQRLKKLVMAPEKCWEEDEEGSQ